MHGAVSGWQLRHWCDIWPCIRHRISASSGIMSVESLLFSSPTTPSCGSTTSPLPVMVRDSLASATTIVACIASTAAADLLPGERKKKESSQLTECLIKPCMHEMTQEHRGQGNAHRGAASTCLAATALPAPLLRASADLDKKKKKKHLHIFPANSGLTRCLVPHKRAS
jgi:hypothetical protein